MELLQNTPSEEKASLRTYRLAFVVYWFDSKNCTISIINLAHLPTHPKCAVIIAPHPLRYFGVGRSIELKITIASVAILSLFHYKYVDVIGLCKVAKLEGEDGIKDQGYSLNPGRYVGDEAQNQVCFEQTNRHSVGM